MTVSVIFSITHTGGYGFPYPPVFFLLEGAAQYPLTMMSSTFPATVPATELPLPPFSTSTTKA